MRSSKDLTNLLSEKDLSKLIGNFESLRVKSIRDIESLNLPSGERECNHLRINKLFTDSFSYGCSTKREKLRIEINLFKYNSYRVIIYQNNPEKSTILVHSRLSFRRAQDFALKARLLFNERGY